MNEHDQAVLALLAVLLVGVAFVHPASFTTAPGDTLLSEDQLQLLRGRSPFETPAPTQGLTGPGPTLAPPGGSERPIYWLGLSIPHWLPALSFLALLAAVLLGWITIPIFVLLALLLTFMLAVGMVISPIFAAFQLVTDVVSLARDLLGGGPDGGGLGGTIRSLPPWLLLLLVLMVAGALLYMSRRKR